MGLLHRCAITRSPRPDGWGGRPFRTALCLSWLRRGFNLLLTTDKNLRYQQNLTGRVISLVVLGQSPSWLVRNHLDAIVAAVNAAPPGSYFEVEIPFQKGPSRSAL